MRIWNAFDAGDCLEELQRSLEALKLALQQQPDLPQDDERRHAVRVAYRALLKAMGDVTLGDPNPEATSFMDMDQDTRAAVIAVVKKAVGVGRLLNAHADCRPELQRQGRGYMLWRVLCSIVATSFIDVASALGCPLYQGFRRLALIGLHWQAAIMAVWVAILVSRALALAVYLAAMAAYVLWAICMDIPARAQGLAALQAGRAAAAELWQDFRVAEACPRLSDVLYATADLYAAALQHNRQRNERVRASWFAGRYSRLFINGHFFVHECGRCKLARSPGHEGHGNGTVPVKQITELGDDEEYQAWRPAAVGERGGPATGQAPEGRAPWQLRGPELAGVVHH
ncbi:hypothetical protein ABPG77_003106 [Micractinium sp. CCAP 211/92]